MVVRKSVEDVPEEGAASCQDDPVHHDLLIIIACQGQVTELSAVTNVTHCSAQIAVRLTPAETILVTIKHCSGVHHFISDRTTDNNLQHYWSSRWRQVVNMYELDCRVLAGVLELSVGGRVGWSKQQSLSQLVLSDIICLLCSSQHNTQHCSFVTADLHRETTNQDTAL